MSKLVIDSMDLAKIINCDYCPAKNCKGMYGIDQCEREVLTLDVVRPMSPQEIATDRNSKEMDRLYQIIGILSTHIGFEKAHQLLKDINKEEV